MTITIMHLYYDLLNLYGENGNVKILKNYLEHQGIKVRIKFTTIDDEINLKDVDFLYIGTGTENNQKLVLKHLLQYKHEIKEFIENNHFVLATGNSIELFGHSLIDKEKKEYQGLHIFDFHSIEENFRIVDEALFKTSFIKDYVIGFQNQNSVIKDYKGTPLFTVIKGTGSYPTSKQEGIYYKHFYGTYLIGPILVRNPKLLKKITKEFIHHKDPNYSIKSDSLFFETKAYEEFLKNYYSKYIHN